MILTKTAVCLDVVMRTKIQEIQYFTNAVILGNYSTMQHSIVTLVIRIKS